MAVAGVRTAVKLAALPFGLVGRRRPGDVVILLYHRVGAGRREIDLPRDLFEEHMALLAERDRPSTLDEALSGKSGGLVVTIDDGYRDFHEHVLPVIERHRVPVVLYLATGLVASPEDRRGDRLTWPQLEEAVGTGMVTVGAHTHSHADLSLVSEAEADTEMRRAQELIEDRLGVACRHFAYPWAVASPEADRAARRLFDTAALGAWRTNRAGRIDRHRLGRTPVLSRDRPLFFRAKARGMLDGEGWAYRLGRKGPWRRT